MISVTNRRHARNFDRVNLFKKCLKQIWHLKSACLLALSIEIIHKSRIASQSPTNQISCFCNESLQAKS